MLNLNRTNQTLAARTNGLELGTRSLVQSKVNVAQDQVIRQDYLVVRADFMRFGIDGPIHASIAISDSRRPTGSRIPSSPWASPWHVPVPVGRVKAGVVADVPPVLQEVVKRGQTCPTGGRRGRAMAFATVQAACTPVARSAIGG
jgi:hypothetical protein